MAALEPLSNALARSDGAQAVQALFSLADRAAKSTAAQKAAADGKVNTTSVPGTEGAEGTRIRDEETGGSGPHEGSERPPTEGKMEEPPPPLPVDPTGKGKTLDLTA